MISDKLVLCIKWGDMYGPEYVNIMYGMVARNLTGAFRLVCFTDDRTGVRPEVECITFAPIRRRSACGGAR